LAALLPAMALAQPGLEQAGQWAVSGPWGHQAIHLVLMRGDGAHHSKILSWEFGWQAKLYGFRVRAGVYAYRLTADGFRDQRMMVVLP
jgi:hypothetical protein